MRFWQKLTEYLFYLFVFLFPWQVKLILRPAATNFNEIGFYFTQCLLLVIILLFLILKLRERNENETISPLWYLLAGLELFVFISVLLAPDRFLALYHYLLFLLALGLFFLTREGTAVFNYQDSFFNKAKIIYSFLAGLLLQAVLGIYQFLSQGSFAFKYLGLALHDPAVLGTAVIETASGRWLRAYGGLDHPNILGGVLALGLLLSAYLLARKKMLNNARNLLESVFLFLFYFIALSALFFTFSRAAWLAFAVGLLILFFRLRRQKDRWVFSRFVALLFFSLTLILIVVSPFHELVAARVSAETRLEQKSISEREQYLGQAATLLKSNWFLGVGLGNYTVALALIEPGGEPTAYQPVHDVLLLLWAESGLISLFFFLAFLYVLFKKNRREAYALVLGGALLVLLFFDHWLLSLPFGVLFFFFILGLI